MAPSREERFLMRQRGAGTRQLRDSGFGIALPSASNTPLAKILSGRKKQTPQQKTQTPQSTRLTLASKLRAATRRTPDTASRLTEEGRLHTTQNDGNGSVTKRRKLNASSPLVSSPSTNQDPQLATLQTPLPQIDEEVGDALTTSIPGDGGANSVGDDNSNQIIPQQSTRKRRKKRKSVGQQHNRRSRVSSGSAVSQEQHSTPAAQNTNDASDEEDDIDSALKPLTPPIRKKRRVASLSATPAPELGSDDDLQSSGTPRSGAQGNTGTELNNVVEKGVVQNSQETTRKQKPRKPVGRPSLTKKGGLPLPSANLDTTTTSQDQPQRRKRKRGRPSRTSQLTTNKGRVQPEAETETNGQTKGVLEGVETQIAGQKQIEDGIDEDEENEEEEEEVQEVEMQSENEEENEDVSNDNSEIEDEIGSTRPAKATQAKKKSRARKSDIRETGGTVRQKSKPNKSRKKQKLPQRRPAKTSSSTRERQASEEVEPKDEPIPVTVHRISHLHRLNFIDGEDDDLAGPATLPKKSSVNAIDVLSQICREMIGKTVENLRRGGEKDRGDKRKAERRRKRKIVETFGDELDGRLFQMSAALDNNYILNANLKKGNKEKTALRDELLDLRRQREEVAIRMDEVRKKHEEATEAARNESELNSMLHDIELAVQTGKGLPQDPDEDLRPTNMELRLRLAAETVSSADGRQGILDRVKGYNAFLERAVAAL